MQRELHHHRSLRTPPRPGSHPPQGGRRGERTGRARRRLRRVGGRRTRPDGAHLDPARCHRRVRRNGHGGLPGGPAARRPGGLFAAGGQRGAHRGRTAGRRPRPRRGWDDSHRGDDADQRTRHGRRGSGLRTALRLASLDGSCCVSQFPLGAHRDPDRHRDLADPGRPRPPRRGAGSPVRSRPHRDRQEDRGGPARG